jgi:hypothetical protein
MSMKRLSRIVLGVGTAFGLGLAAVAVLAQTGVMGPGMMHGMDHAPGAGGHRPMAGAVNMLTRQDAGSSADMGLVHDLVMNHTKIKRTVTNLPDGIRTVTESDDPQVAQSIKAHVASMSQRLKDGREFNIFSPTLPVLFENRDKIQSVVEVTEKGTIVTRTSTDAKVVAALQGHATEVTELAQEGPVAMMRGMMSRMAMGARAPRSNPRPGEEQAHQAPTPQPSH